MAATELKVECRLRRQPKHLTVDQTTNLHLLYSLQCCSQNLVHLAIFSGDHVLNTAQHVLADLAWLQGVQFLMPLHANLQSNSLKLYIAQSICNGIMQAQLMTVN